MTFKCSRPDCRAETDNRVEDGWTCGDLHDDAVEHWVEGLPEEGLLCLHHKEAVEALEEGDIERFKLLASI